MCDVPSHDCNDTSQEQEMMINKLHGHYTEVEALGI